MMKRIIKVGDSIAATIPAKFAHSMNWEEGDFINVTRDGKKIIIQKIIFDQPIKTGF